jgi:hypothetical protein
MLFEAFVVLKLYVMVVWDVTLFCVLCESSLPLKSEILSVTSVEGSEEVATWVTLLTCTLELRGLNISWETSHLTECLCDFS